jgi:hypothetical protein
LKLKWLVVAAAGALAAVVAALVMVVQVALQPLGHHY